MNIHHKKRVVATLILVANQSDIQRADESPEGVRPPQLVGTQSVRGRSAVPPPPPFYEAVFMAGGRAGATIRSSQPIQILSDGDDDDQASTPRAVNQPQGEPEPELPGGTEPSESDITSRTNEGETDDHDDEYESPEHTDTDPYKDPTDSQADVEQTADTEQVTIVDSPEEPGTGGEAVDDP